MENLIKLIEKEKEVTGSLNHHGNRWGFPVPIFTKYDLETHPKGGRRREKTRYRTLNHCLKITPEVII